MFTRKHKMYSKKEYTEGLLLTKIQTDRLIELYKADPGLWDMSSIAFYNKDNRRKALQNIVDKLKEEFPGFEATVDQLQNKLSNIRGYYTRELSKIRKSQRNGIDYVSTWRLFDIMDCFLRSHIIPRRAPACDLIDLDMSCKTEPDEYDTDEDILYIHSDEEQSSHSTLPIHNIHSDQGLHSTKQEEEPSSSTSQNQATESNPVNLCKEPRTTNINRIKRPRRSCSQTMVTDSESMMSDHEIKANPKNPKLSISHVETTNKEPELLNKENKTTADNDDDDHDMLFARYIAMELKKIKDPHTKAFVKFKIHSIIYEAQIGAISTNM